MLNGVATAQLVAVLLLQRGRVTAEASESRRPRQNRQLLRMELDHSVANPFMSSFISANCQPVQNRNGRRDDEDD
jgi:hypothetical protein